MSKNPHAVALGRKGGKAKTVAKADAARANGKKGGRPKKVAAITPPLPAGAAPQPATVPQSSE